MRAAAAGLFAVVLLGAVACGGGGGTAQPSGSIKVTMTEFKFDPSNITVPHGKVVFYLVNSGTVAHDMIIADPSGNRIAGSDLVSTGEATVFTVDNLAAGTYTIYCNQPGHRDSGMQGTLTAT